MADDLVRHEQGIKDSLLTPDIKEAFESNADKAALVREINFAVQILKGNDYLKKCKPDSIRNAVKNVALTGLTLNPAQGLAYLVPRKAKREDKQQSCCLDPSYKGLCHIAVQSGAVYDISAHVVYKKDEFYVEQGTNAQLKHIISLEPERGEATHVYAIAELHHGIKKFEIMTIKEVEKIRNISKQPNGLMWKDFYGEGCRKTVIKKICKYLPQKGALSEAVALSHEVSGNDDDIAFISGDQAKEIQALIEKKGACEEAFLNYMKVESIEKIMAPDFDRAVFSIQQVAEK